MTETATSNPFKVPPDKTGLYYVGETLYYYWLHYSSVTQTDSDDITVTYTLKYGVDDASNFFSVNRKTYNLDSYDDAYDELERLGTVEINALISFLDKTCGVKLVTTDLKGAQETGTVSHDPGNTSIVVAAYSASQQVDESALQNLTYLDVDGIVSGTSSSWTAAGGTPFSTTINVKSGKGLSISGGLSLKSKDIMLGGKGFTVEFYSYVSSVTPAETCLCDIVHPDHDIKIKLLEEEDENTGETLMLAGVYLDNILMFKSKSDISILDTLNHFAVVYQHSDTCLYFFINGTLIGNVGCLLTEQTAYVLFNYDRVSERSTLVGTLDMVRISGTLARWIPNEKFIDYDTSRVVDQTGAVWQMHSGEVEVAPVEQNKFGTGLRFSNDSYITLDTPIQLGGADFTIDFWYYIDTDRTQVSGAGSASEEGGIFTINVGTTYDLGFHFIGVQSGKYKNCLHSTVGSPRKYIRFDTTPFELHHVALVYVFAEDTIYVYNDGVKQTSIFQSQNRLTTAQDFVLTVGWYHGTGTKGYFKGSVDEFRISAGIARWVEDFEVPTEPYEIDDFTKALLRTTNFAGVKKYKMVTELVPETVTKTVYEEVTVNDITVPDWNIKAVTGDIGTMTIAVTSESEIRYAGSEITLDYSRFCVISDFTMLPEVSDCTVYKIVFDDGNMIHVHVSSDSVMINDKKIADMDSSDLLYIDVDYSFQDNTIEVDLSLGSYTGTLSDFIDISTTRKVESISIFEGGSFAKALGFYIGNGIFCLSDGDNLDRNLNYYSLAQQKDFALSRNPYVCAFFACYIFDEDFAHVTERTILVEKTVTTTEMKEVQRMVEVEEEEEEEFVVENPNYTFDPPVEIIPVVPYSALLQRKLLDFYIPLSKHFDDTKFTVVPKKPVQTDIPVYDGLTEFEPVWDSYDPDQLKIEGDIRSKEAGVHYVTFIPWNDHVWSDGTVTPKAATWKVSKGVISTYPSQTEVLTYNGTEQSVNLSNYDPNTMTLSGTLSAISANDADNPFYIAYTTPKDNFTWVTGSSSPYEVRWQIKNG